MTIICESTQVEASALAQYISGHVVPLVGLAGLDEVMSRESGHSVLVIGPGPSWTEALAAAEHIGRRYPMVRVLLVRESVGVEELTRAMRSGVREVIPAANLSELDAACQRNGSAVEAMHAPTLPTTPARGQVVTVFAAKGGCGKTTVATNLAVTLAASGQRVCLLDLDLAFGDVAITLGLPPTRTIAALAGINSPLDEATAASLLTAYAPNLSCVLAPVEPGQAERVSAPATSALISVLSAMFDYVLIDTPSQLSEHVLGALDASHLQVLLTAPEVPSLKNLRVTLDMLDLLSYDKSRRLVVLNRADTEVGLTQDDVEAVIKSPVACHVPSSRDVPISINKGMPIAAQAPAHPVSVALRGLASHHLLREPEPTAVAASDGRRRGRIGRGRS